MRTEPAIYPVYDPEEKEAPRFWNHSDDYLVVFQKYDGDYGHLIWYEMRSAASVAPGMPGCHVYVVAPGLFANLANNAGPVFFYTRIKRETLTDNTTMSARLKATSGFQRTFVAARNFIQEMELDN